MPKRPTALHLVTLALILASVLLTACSPRGDPAPVAAADPPCDPAEYISAAEEHFAAWEDLEANSRSVPIVELLDVVANMQARRDLLAGVDTPPCATAARSATLRYMAQRIEIENAIYARECPSCIEEMVDQAEGWRAAMDEEWAALTESAVGD